MKSWRSGLLRLKLFEPVELRNYCFGANEAQLCLAHTVIPAQSFSTSSVSLFYSNHFTHYTLPPFKALELLSHCLGSYTYVYKALCPSIVTGINQ